MSTLAGAPDARAQLAALIFAVLLLDEDDNIVEANHAAEEMLGRSARKLCEKRFWDVIGISDERLSERLASMLLIDSAAPVALPSAAVGRRVLTTCDAPRPETNMEWMTDTNERVVCHSATARKKNGRKKMKKRRMPARILRMAWSSRWFLARRASTRR